MGKDGRSLSSKALTAVRIQGVKALRKGVHPEDVAATLGVHVATVYRWQALAKQGGLPALKAKHRGTKGDRTLTPEQEKYLRRWIRTKLPADFGLAFGRWIHAAVQALIREKFGIEMPLRTVGEYTLRWRFSPQKTR